MTRTMPHPILTDTPCCIKIDNLTVRYEETLALKGISAEIPSNRVTVLIGPSGCGKSTTLRSINGLVKPESGEIIYSGKPILLQDPTLLRREMGYAIQSVGLMPHMTVRDNVALVPRLLGWEKKKRYARAEELLSLVRLDPAEYLHKYPRELSGGEAQRVGVARALGVDPPVLLMDEPFGAVDPLNREILQDEFIRIQRQLKKTVVFVTHDLDEAIRLADYLIILKTGEIIQADTPENILVHPGSDFVEQFLGPDRALKRLTLFTVDRYLTEAKTGSRIPGEEERSCLWQIDDEGVPWGGMARIQGRVIQRKIDSGTQTVQLYSSLKECMARILSLGLPAVPVLDDQGKLCGEVTYESIQKISIS